MSGTQTDSAIGEQNNEFEVVSYEKLVCKLENMFNNFNCKSSNCHEFLSSKYQNRPMDFID